MSACSSSHKMMAAVLTAGLLTVSAARAQYAWSADFNNMSTPAGMMLRGNATMPINSGVSNTACLALTPASQGMQGDVVLPRFWGDDETPADVSVRFSLKFGGNSSGVLGDGFSLSIVNGIPEVLGDEEGFEPGPSFEFDTFENDDEGVTDGGLGVRWPNTGSYRHTWGGAPNRLSGIFPDRNAWYSMDIRARLHSKSSTVKVNGAVKADQEAWNPSTIIHPDGRIILAARTGDAFNSHLIDNLSVEVTPYPIFRQQPASQQVTSGTSVLFEAQTNFNTLPWRGISTFTLVSSVTSEWQIRHPGGAWTAVPDNTLPLLWGPDAEPFIVFSNLREDRGLWEGDDPAWSINGTEVRCVLTWHNGYTTATQPATLRLMPQPQEFPGNITLWNSFPQGSASVAWPHEEGKVLRLTPAEPDCSGGFVFDELANNNLGEPRLLDSFIGTFQYRGSAASEPRADGFSFNLAGDLSATLPPGAGEEGAGTGLTVSFDAYSNGSDDPTGIDVLWEGQRLARMPMAADALFSEEWITFYIRINFAGTLDLAIGGNAILTDLPLPGWAGIPAAKMAFYGRTGTFWQQQDVRELAVWFTATTVQQFVPELTLQPWGPNAISLQWNVSSTDVWELFESADLIAWTKNTSTPVGNGPSRQVFIETNQLRRFFRLQQRPPGGQ